MSKRKSTGGQEETNAEKKQKTEAGSVVATKVPGLLKVTVDDVLASRKHKHTVVTLEHNNTVLTALEELAKHRILSAPVLLAASLEDNFEGDGDDSGTYMGMLSVEDIVRYLARHIKDERKEKGADNDAVMKSVEEHVLVKPVQIVMGRDTSFVFNKGSGRTTLAEAISEGFLQGQSRSEEAKRERPHVHRLAVFDIRGRITAIISQSDVVVYLTNRLHLLGDLARKTLADLKLANSGQSVVSVKHSVPLLDAFTTMADQQVSAVAVVDDEGKLAGNLSASDLRGFTKADFGYLDQTVRDFLLERSRAALDEGKKATGLPVITLKATDTYEHTIKTISENKVHRLYVTDDKGHPVSVVTLSDLLRVLV